ncbi:protein FAM114A2 isoform X2 [Aphidius gifuensis]|uniref:protein FAM114A2 isoform X2 n=1 Tax=Aphidius gifuensis TaxID=684658 RepID=UPI001CDC240C|nr:protein FAM114A2 isoform X2 [Aphidius gifuensis]
MDSDSDCAFESADEEIEVRRGTSTRNLSANKNRTMSSNFNSAIDSDSDDDNEFVTTNVNTASWSTEISDVQNVSKVKNNKSTDVTKSQDDEINLKKQSSLSEEKINLQKRKKPERKQKTDNKPSGFGAKKLGSKIIPDKSSVEVSASIDDEKKKSTSNQECWEFNDEEAMKILQKESQKSKIKWSKSKDDVHDDLVDVPEELKSNKSFKEVFKLDKWEAVNDEKIEKNLSQDKIQSVLEKIPSATTTPDDSSSSGWGSWGSWGVNSLINTASIGVSTISSHVSHGLTLLEETMNVPESEDVEKPIEQLSEKKMTEDKVETTSQDGQASSFGFENFMYGVSSITKLVESTGSKVINGGLETLETIGKKTMEVLQDGDPGLKKKRAFFMNEGDKPILSQMLREAKDKAEIEEKSIEGKEFARKVHFEILFDDFQGLVHLEALEMLSKQCVMKIQQKLVTLDLDDMNSIQETLDEIKELCDLGDEDDEEDNEDDENLNDKLNNSCKELGVDINYHKINEIWEESKLYIDNISKPDSSITDLEIFQNAISTLAKFTAVSVERFHKTAELLLIKERRSTVNEADALVQLTKILSGQIGIAASLFSKCLNERIEKYKKPSEIVDITTIFLEASNASSYIQDAFRLLMPILQVGAI